MANVINSTIVEIEAGYTDDMTAREVFRNLQVLFNTVAGEQALDRDFGIDPAVMDNSSPDARSLLVAEYVKKTQMYEPRAIVDHVEWIQGDLLGGNLTPKVVIDLV